MRDYISLRGGYLQGILAMEAPWPECSRCQGQRPLWRCMDCLGRPAFCKDCCRDSHWATPFHRVEQWKEGSFAASWLTDVGVWINVGHNGQPCPTYTRGKKRQADLEESLGDGPAPPETEKEWEWEWGSERKWKDQDGNTMMTIVDTTGLHPIGVRPCICPNADPKHMQLFKTGLFPATASRPKTCFTFSVLDEFRLTNLECKTATNNFHTLLQRRTSNAFSKDIPVDHSIFRHALC